MRVAFSRSDLCVQFSQHRPPRLPTPLRSPSVRSSCRRRVARPRPQSCMAARRFPSSISSPTRGVPMRNRGHASPSRLEPKSSQESVDVARRVCRVIGGAEVVRRNTVPGPMLSMGWLCGWDGGNYVASARAGRTTSRESRAKARVDDANAYPNTASLNSTETLAMG